MKGKSLSHVQLLATPWTAAYQYFKAQFEDEGVSSEWGGVSEKAMATHSSTLAWKIPWMEEPGRLQSMGSLRVGHD